MYAVMPNVVFIRYCTVGSECNTLYLVRILSIMKRTNDTRVILHLIQFCTCLPSDQIVNLSQVSGTRTRPGAATPTAINTWTRTSPGDETDEAWLHGLEPPLDMELMQYVICDFPKRHNLNIHTSCGATIPPALLNEFAWHRICAIIQNLALHLLVDKTLLPGP